MRKTFTSFLLLSMLSVSAATPKYLRFTRVTAVRRPTLRDPLQARTVWGAVAVGATMRLTVAFRIATTTLQATGTTISAFASCCAHSSEIRRRMPHKYFEQVDVRRMLIESAILETESPSAIVRQSW